MNIILWIIFGALAGWIASIVMKTNPQQGFLMDVVVGVAGAFIGGFIMEMLNGQGFNFNFDIGSLLVAILGAIVLLFILKTLRRA